MAKTTVAKGPEITAENATEPVDHHNEEVSQSATLVLRNLGVYILARYKNFPPPPLEILPCFCMDFSTFPSFYEVFHEILPCFSNFAYISSPLGGGKWPVYIPL